jgi:hypothetical protein
MYAVLIQQTAMQQKSENGPSNKPCRFVGGSLPGTLQLQSRLSFGSLGHMPAQ